MTQITLRNVSKTYGAVTALDDVSLTVDSGTPLGLIGTNGAGKTTLFRMLVGHETPDEGEVRVGEMDPRNGPAVRNLVGYLPEHAGFDPRLTGREVLTFHARMRGVDEDSAHRVERVLHTVGLADAADRRVDGYSNGMNRRLGLATLLVGNPQVLLLDEPTAGLDPSGVEAFHDLIGNVRQETDITLVVTSHILSEVERLCDEIAILNEGELIAHDDIESLRAEIDDTATIDARLGEDPETTLQSFADEYPQVAITYGHGTRVELTCASDEAYDVLSALQETATVESLEVRQPSLNNVFDEAIRPDRSREVQADD